MDYTPSQSATTKTGSSLEEQIRKLPISRHFKGGLTTIEEASQDKFKALSLVFKLAIIGALAYGAWVYAIPMIMTTLGKIAVAALTGGSIILGALSLPAFFKWAGNIARKFHKHAIEQDPFREFEKQKKAIRENQEQARNARAQIKGLERQMQKEARENEKLGEKYRTQVLVEQKRAEALKASIASIEQKLGKEAAKGDDNWVADQADLYKLLMGSGRLEAQLNQADDFVQKYGSRANIMKKMGHKLTMVEAAMDTKVLDFDATVEILKKDYEFASKSAAATEHAKAAMMFEDSWELEIALNAVSTTIANDIATTAGNFKDIQTLTSDFDFNSDTAFANLNSLADKISTGESEAPDADKYGQEGYRLTEKDKASTPGFDSFLD